MGEILLFTDVVALSQGQGHTGINSNNQRCPYALQVWKNLVEKLVLLLLCSQLYRCDSPFLVRFLRTWPFNPSIEVVTFCPCGWCVLCVFLLPSFTCLGHECRHLLSPCDGMYVCRDKTSVYTLIQEYFGGNGVRTHANSKGKIPSSRGSEEDWTHNTASHRTVGPNTLPTGLFQPPKVCPMLTVFALRDGQMDGQLPSEWKRQNSSMYYYSCG